MPGGFDGIISLLRNNATLKLVALGAAIVCWYTLREVTSFERNVRNVPLRIQTAAGMAVLDQSVSEVTVLCRGSEGDLRYLDAQRVSLSIDMRDDTKPGTRTIRLTTDRVRTPSGVRALVVEPPQVTLSLDIEGDKVVPVKADLVGSPLEDFEVDRVVCTPATVTLHGPRARLAQVSSVRTEPLELEGRMRSFQLERELLKPAENWSARMEPSHVRVEVSIVELSARKELAEVPVNALVQAGADGSVTFRPSTVKIVLQGRAGRMQELEKERVHAYVDCSSLRAGQALDLPVHVQSAQGIEVVAIEPHDVRATMESR